MNNIEYTSIVDKWLATERFTKMELSEKLGISRPTLDNRLEKDNWKKLEKSLILDLR